MEMEKCRNIVHVLVWSVPRFVAGWSAKRQNDV